MTDNKRLTTSAQNQIVEYDMCSSSFHHNNHLRGANIVHNVSQSDILFKVIIAEGALI